MAIAKHMQREKRLFYAKILFLHSTYLYEKNMPLKIKLLGYDEDYDEYCLL